MVSIRTECWPYSGQSNQPSEPGWSSTVFFVLHQILNSAGSLSAPDAVGAGVEVERAPQRVLPWLGGQVVHQVAELVDPALDVLEPGSLVGEAPLAQVEPRATVFGRCERQLEQGGRSIVDGDVGCGCPADGEEALGIDRLHADGDAAVAVELHPAATARSQVQLGSLTEPLDEFFGIGEGTPDAGRRGGEDELAFDSGKDGSRGHSGFSSRCRCSAARR